MNNPFIIRGVTRLLVIMFSSVAIIAATVTIVHSPYFITTVLDLNESEILDIEMHLFQTGKLVFVFNFIGALISYFLYINPRV